MQADEEIETKEEAVQDWKQIQEDLKEKVTLFNNKHKVHKQTIGRMYEPTCYVKCLITGTDWPSFFRLRAEYAAEPHLGYLATIMLEQYLNNTPEEKREFDWHIPFILPSEEEDYSIADQLIISVARCARTSYNNFYGTNDFEKDKILFERLKEDGHWSPFEHQATAIDGVSKTSNFSKMWLQQRKFVETYKPLDLSQRLEEMKELCKSRGFTFS